MQNDKVFETFFSLSNSRGKLKNCKINKNIHKKRTIMNKFEPLILEKSAVYRYIYGEKQE